MANNPFDIPDQIRDLAERSIAQARTAYGQLMDAMLKAQSTSLTSVPATAMSTSFSNIQERAINFARQNFSNDHSWHVVLPPAALRVLEFLHPHLQK